jgi:hypothetical protein
LADVLQSEADLADMEEIRLRRRKSLPHDGFYADMPEPIRLFEQLHLSRWFTRGWTLQELLAPDVVIFFDSNWQRFGEKGDFWFCCQLSQITRIWVWYLCKPATPDALTSRMMPWMDHHRPVRSFTDASVSEKMSWLALRETTRVEDLAYCMLGIFGINMPLLYGEGSKAFLRLQEEIIKVSNDQTIFCWSYIDDTQTDRWNSVLAPNPHAFLNGAQYVSDPRYVTKLDYSLTNNGLSITLPSIDADDDVVIVLLAVAEDHDCRVAIAVVASNDLLSRSRFYSKPLRIPSEAVSHGQ